MALAFRGLEKRGLVMDGEHEPHWHRGEPAGTRPSGSVQWGGPLSPQFTPAAGVAAPDESGSLPGSRFEVPGAQRPQPGSVPGGPATPRGRHRWVLLVALVAVLMVLTAGVLLVVRNLEVAGPTSKDSPAVTQVPRSTRSVTATLPDRVGGYGLGSAPIGGSRLYTSLSGDPAVMAVMPKAGPTDPQSVASYLAGVGATGVSWEGDFQCGVNESKGQTICSALMVDGTLNIVGKDRAGTALFANQLLDAM